MAAVAERIRRLGPLPFNDIVDAALYGPGGFFAEGGGAGRRADFLTSPEVGPLFGSMIARFIDEQWDALGQPDFFLVVEAGAGRGTLVTSVLGANPRCIKALRYVCVERSKALRDQIEATLPVEPAINIFGVLSTDEDDFIETSAEGSASVIQGPIVAVLAELPAVSFSGVVFANELLDNLAFRLLERAEDVELGWAEVRVGLSNDEQGLIEVLVEASSDLCSEANSLAPDAPAGARLPVQDGAQSWLHQALSIMNQGRLVIIDYADRSPSLVTRPCQDWLRTYRSHERGGHPLVDFGDQDITCEVAIDQLARVRPPDRDTSQTDWLNVYGIEALVSQAKQTWHERAAIGDLEAIKARSRINEAEALLDPSGLGAFRVLEWII